MKYEIDSLRLCFVLISRIESYIFLIEDLEHGFVAKEDRSKKKNNSALIFNYLYI